MEKLEDFTDDRLKAWCIHCGQLNASLEMNQDHVPTKSLLSKELRVRGAHFDKGSGNELDYLPQVSVCKRCNSSFAADESYFLCVLHAVIAGSLYPEATKHPEAAKVLQSNRHIVRALKAMPDGQMLLFDDLEPFTIYPDPNVIERVIIKNARGHAYHELGEPMLRGPDHVTFVPLMQLDAGMREAFEADKHGSDIASWPEVGSRMTIRLLDSGMTVGGWLDVEPGRYRYSVDWSDSISVKTVIWEYLATETIWRE